ncbi:MAG: phosphate signaling complex protein PhoU [Phycisphaeraceae bacterium]
MAVHQQRQIEKLKRMIRALGARAQSQLDSAMRAVKDRDEELAHRVIAEDDRINQVEIEIEEECLHTLALYQPVAFDLRYVVSVLKINNDLERIADQAVNIAQQASFLSESEPLPLVPYDMDGMAERVQEMLRDALEALVEMDAERAERVRRADEEVDAIHREMYANVETTIQKHPEQARQLIHLMNISRQLERTADLTVNIAEDVLYTAQGDIIRHATARAKVEL